MTYFNVPTIIWTSLSENDKFLLTIHRPNSWIQMRQKSWHSQSPLLSSRPWTKMVWNWFKSEKSQDYAQKPQRHCTFMNNASGLPSKNSIMHCVPLILPLQTFCWVYTYIFGSIIHTLSWENRQNSRAKKQHIFQFYETSISIIHPFEITRDIRHYANWKYFSFVKFQANCFCPRWR